MRRREREAALKTLREELAAVDQEKQAKSNQIMEETRTQLDNYVTTPQGQAKLNKAVDMLICKGKPASEAREQSYLYFLKKMSSQKEKRLEEEMDKKKQEIMDRITQIENEKIAFEEELKTLWFVLVYC